MKFALFINNFIIKTDYLDITDIRLFRLFRIILEKLTIEFFYYNIKYNINISYF